MDRTEKREFVASLACRLRRDVDGRGDPQQRAHRGRGDGSAAADAGGGGDVPGREEPAGHPRPGWDPIRRHQAAAEGADRARVVGATRWRWPRRPSSSPGPTRSSSCSAAPLGTQTLDAAGVKALSELPSLEALRARLLGLIAAPATRIAGVLQAPGGQLARVLGGLCQGARGGTRGRLSGALRGVESRPATAGLHGTDQRLD